MFQVMLVPNTYNVIAIIVNIIFCRLLFCCDVLDSVFIEDIIESVNQQKNISILLQAINLI